MHRLILVFVWAHMSEGMFFFTLCVKYAIIDTCFFFLIFYTKHMLRVLTGSTSQTKDVYCNTQKKHLAHTLISRGL